MRDSYRPYTQNGESRRRLKRDVPEASKLKNALAREKWEMSWVSCDIEQERQLNGS